MILLAEEVAIRLGLAPGESAGAPGTAVPFVSEARARQ